MSIFNSDKQKGILLEKVLLDEYVRKLDERKKELDNLNEILRGLRSEVSSLMLEIKSLADELKIKTEEKELLEKSIEELNHQDLLLLNEIEEKRSALFLLNEDLSKIKYEIISNLSIQEKLDKVKKEFEIINNSLDKKRTELNYKTQTDILKTFPSVLCEAITKEGNRCKRFAVKNSEFCSAHLKSKRKKNDR